MPEITEAKIMEAFGLEAPAADAGAGAQEQEPAAPAAEDYSPETETGAQEQEVAEPAAETDNADDHSEPTAGNADEEADPGQNPENKPLTPEQRRQNAARRRQQEQQAAIDQAVAQAIQAEQEKTNAMMQDFFSRMGLKDGRTGNAITTMEQFYDWKNYVDMEQLNSDLKSGKATAEQLSQMIANHPDVKLAQQVVRQTQQAQVQQQSAADQARIQTELTEIGKLNPEIKGVADLLTMPKAEEFKGYVAKGYGFLDAYKLSHMEEITNQKAAAARQQAMNNARSKDHLNATGSSRGGGAVAVPAQEMAMYRAFNPNATDAEIQAHYNKNKKP